MLSTMSACSDKSAVMTSDRLALQKRNLGVIKEFGYLFETDQRWQGNPNLSVLDKKYHFFYLVTFASLHVQRKIIYWQINPFTATVFSTQPLHTTFQNIQICVMDKLFALWHSAMYI